MMTLPRFSSLAKGTLSFGIPSLRTTHGYGNPLGTASAESCYSIFLRHLTLLRRARGISGVPRVVAEIGPGSSIGVGLAALLAGSERYYGLDVVDFTNPTVDVTILGAIASLFRHRAPIPAAGNHSRRFPDLDSYSWPDWLDLGLSEEWESKVAIVRKDIASRSERLVKIIAPWTDRTVINDASVDWIISQSVLEHVDELDDAYAAMAQWLKPGGYASHLIDFSSHRMTGEWNGHWAINDRIWHLMRGKRPYLLNRCSYAEHLKIAAAHGLTPVMEMRTKRFDGLIPEDFAPQFRNVSDEDARSIMAFVILHRL